MKKISMFVLAAVLFGCSPSGKTLVTVGSSKITESDLQFLATINPSIAMQLSNPMGKKQLLDNLVEQELLYQASLKNGINKDQRIKEKIKLYQKVIIAQGYLDKRLEEESKKHYETEKNNFEQLELAHIMVKYATPADLKNKKFPKGLSRRTEQEALALANKIRGRLDKGEDFAKLAKDLSDDKSTGDHGGDMGFITRDDRRLAQRGMKPLGDKAFEMKMGEVAGPIKTDQGYHLLKLLQPAELKSFEEVKDRVEQQLRNQIRQEVMAELKGKIKITYNDGEVKPLPPAAAPVAPAAPQSQGSHP